MKTVELHTWIERDRAHVELRDAATNETIIEWWDEEFYQAIEDGFLDPRDLEGSATAYAETIGIL